MFVHGDNLKQKENHKTKYTDEESKKYLVEIRAEYENWKKKNLGLKGPLEKPSDFLDGSLPRSR